MPGDRGSQFPDLSSFTPAETRSERTSMPAVVFSGAARRKSDFPPFFPVRRTSRISIVSSMIFSMSYNVSAAADAATRASISTPVFQTAETVAVISMDDFAQRDLHAGKIQGHLVAVRNQEACIFRRLYPCDSRHGQRDPPSGRFPRGHRRKVAGRHTSVARA